MNEIEKFLKEKGITPTPVRILLYNSLKNSLSPVSLTELEISLESIDKSTISRTLNTFKSHHLIHSFSDGSGSVKYELCLSEQHEKDNDQHVHFRCEKCGKTICFSDIKIPKVELPENYKIHECNYIISGICCECSK